MAPVRFALLLAAVVLTCPSSPAAQSGAFTDDPLVAGVMQVRRVHVVELRTRINALRVASGLPALAFTDPGLAPGTTVRAMHVTELRAAIIEVYQRLGRPLPAFAEAIHPAATLIRAAHIAELRAAVIAAEAFGGGPNDDEDLQFSPGVITLVGVSETTFNSIDAAVRFDVANAQFSTNADDVRVFRRGQIVEPAFVQVTATSVTVPPGILEDGPNELDLLARDATGRFIDFSATVWAGSAALSGSVVDENGLALAGAEVRVALAIDRTVGQTVTSSPTGAFAFANVPAWSVVLDASAPGRRGSLTVRGDADPVSVRAHAIGPPSPIDNNDFSMATAGWVIEDPESVEIVEHVEGAGAVSVTADTDFDLKLTTGGVEGARSISRTFTPKPGARHVKVRYRFVTSEVPGGFFGTEFDDAFSVSIRSEMGGGAVSESASMNSLGLGAFDAEGATTWRERRLPVGEFGDVVRVDISVANVADELFDSYVVVDAVSEPSLVLSDVELEDIDGSELEFLSVSGTNPYFGGKTRIYGSLSLEGGDDDTPVTITLDIVQNGTIVAFAGFVGPAVPTAVRASDVSTEEYEYEFEGLLFELANEQAAKIDLSADGTVLLVARARAANGKQSIFPVGKVTLLSRYGGGNRFGARNGDLGGDDWAQPGLVAMTTHFAGNTYGDFSNMNGGGFPPHDGHETGDEVDGWFPGYNARDAATAATMLDQLNDPAYGSEIARVLVTYERTSADPFWNAIRNVVLADGRRASDVIQPAPGYTTRFHWERVTISDPDEEELSAAAARRRRLAP